MKKILVTGGLGYVGSHLCEKLVELGYEVCSIDNKFAGNDDYKVANVRYFFGHTKNISEVLKLENFVPELVYHLAEYARVEQSLTEDFSTIFDLNLLGTSKVLEYCLKNKCKIIYSGSSTKFADGGLARDATPYAWSKATNTELVKNFGEWYGLKYAITYFYNVTGGRERGGKYGTLFGIYKDKFLRGEPLTVTSPGTQRRNFTHINDIVSALILVGQNGDGDGYGIGDERTYSVLEIANMFGGEIIMTPEKRGNRTFSFLDVEKTRALGWEVRNSIVDEIEKIKKQKK
jgi:UDP-glucose 4-epimerase